MRSCNTLALTLGILLACASCSDDSATQDAGIDGPSTDATPSAEGGSDAPPTDATPSADGGSDAPRSDAPRSDATKPDATKPDGPKPDSGLDVGDDLIATPDAAPRTWQLVPTPTGAPGLVDIHGSSSTDVWAIGAARVHFDGKSWTVNSTGKDQGIWVFSPSNAWSIDQQGSRWHFTGSAWTKDSAAGAALWMSLWGEAPGHLWMVGSKIGIPVAGLVSDNTSGSWAQTTLPSAGIAERIHGSSSKRIWIVGQDGKGGGSTWRFDGKDWKSVPTNLTGKTLHGVWGVPLSDDAWAVGQQTILRYTQGAWSDATPKDIGKGWLVDIWGSAKDDVWAVGYTDRDTNAGTFGGAMIYHYDGKAWTRVSAPSVITPTTPALFGVWGASAKNIWAVGAKGTILYLN